jgi:predicted O-methyltransferase YrrM
VNELGSLCRPYDELAADFARERERDPVIAALDRIWSDGGFRADDGTIARAAHSVGRRDGTILYGLARAVAPRAMIETGFAFGISTACLLAGARGARHTSIDSGFRAWAGPRGLEHWRGLGLAFELLEEPSEYALPRLASGGATAIQLGYVDGVHTFDGALIDCFYLDRMLEVGGLLVLHDADAPAISTLLAFLRANRRFVISDAYGPTIAVCQKLGDDDRSWGHFEPFEVAARRHWDRGR